jgi:hypothetical protein
MIINKNQKIEKCCSTDDTRYVLNNPWTASVGEPDAEGYRPAKMVATDGRMMVVLPVLLEPGETAGQIPVEAIKQARKERTPKLHANGSVTLPNGVVMPRNHEVKLPAYEQVIPAEDRPVTYKVCFNAALLAKMQEAMGSEFVTLEFADPKDIIVVKGSKVEGIGYLMPARMS